MRPRFVVVALLSAVSSAESLPAESLPKIVTVCEMLRHPAAYSREFALAGRCELDGPIPIAIVEDHCADKRAARVAISFEELFLTESEVPEVALDQQTYDAALVQLRKSSPLLPRRQPAYRTDGDVLRQKGWELRKDPYVIWWGRLKRVDRAIKFVPLDLPHYINE